MDPSETIQIIDQVPMNWRQFEICDLEAARWLKLGYLMTQELIISLLQKAYWSEFGFQIVSVCQCLNESISPSNQL